MGQWLGLSRSVGTHHRYACFRHFEHNVTSVRAPDWIVGGTGALLTGWGSPRTTLINKMSKLAIARNSGHNFPDGEANMWTAPLSQQG